MFSDKEQELFSTVSEATLGELFLVTFFFPTITTKVFLV